MINAYDYMELVNYINDNLSNKASDIADALELVGLVFDDIYDSIADEAKRNIDLQNLPEASSILKLSNDVLNIKKDIENTKVLFVDESEEENIIEEELNIDKNHTYIDYENYSVDNTIAHTLYEDYTFTRPCAFELREVKYGVNSMRDVLIKLCEILLEENPEKIKKFVDDPTMKGRKNSYFSSYEVVENGQSKNIKLNNSDVYVWVNMSCNQIRNVIRKILTKFKINISDFKIFIRADFTELHKETENKEIVKESNQEKIGQHVRKCFKQLENYPFTVNELNAMQSGEWTLNTFGFSTPMIKRYDYSKPISEQIRKRGQNRYWVDTFKLQGVEYFVTSQWLKIHGERFDEWFNSLNRG